MNIGEVVQLFHSAKDTVAKEATVIKVHANGLVNVQWVEAGVTKVLHSLSVIAHDAQHFLGGAFAKLKAPAAPPTVPVVPPASAAAGEVKQP